MHKSHTNLTLALGPWPQNPGLRNLALEPGLGTLVLGPWPLASWPLASWPLASWPLDPGLLALAGGQTDVRIYIRMYRQTKYP